MLKPRQVTYAAVLVCLPLLGIVLGQDAGKQTAQPSFSQSVMYQPRESSDPKAKKQDKNNDNNGTAKPAGDTATIKEGPMTIPVSVLDGSSKIVLGLEKTNFRVFIDAKKAEIASVQIRPGILNVILLVDTSPSTIYTSKAIQNVATAIVEELEELDSVSVIRFESDVKILTELTDDRDKLRRAIRNIKLGITGTALYDAVRYVFEQKTPVIEGRTVLFILTDGVDTTSKIAGYASSLEIAEKGDATVIPIFFDTIARNSKDIGRSYNSSVMGGVSGAISSELLDKSRKENEKIAADYERGKMYLNDLVFLSGGRAIPAKSFEDAPKETAGQIIAELRQRYLLTFAPGEPAPAGQRKRILIRVDRPSLAVLARGSYIVKPL